MTTIKSVITDWLIKQHYYIIYVKMSTNKNILGKRKKYVDFQLTYIDPTWPFVTKIFYHKFLPNEIVKKHSRSICY